MGVFVDSGGCMCLWTVTAGASSSQQADCCARRLAAQVSAKSHRWAGSGYVHSAIHCIAVTALSKSTPPKHTKSHIGHAKHAQHTKRTHATNTHTHTHAHSLCTALSPGPCAPPRCSRSCTGGGIYQDHCHVDARPQHPGPNLEALVNPLDAQLLKPIGVPAWGWGGGGGGMSGGGTLRPQHAPAAGCTPVPQWRSKSGQAAPGQVARTVNHRLVAIGHVGVAATDAGDVASGLWEQRKVCMCDYVKQDDARP